MTLKENISYYSMYGALWTLSLLPFCALYAISDFLYVVMYKWIHYRKKVIDENLLVAFPEKTAEEREKIAQGFYHHLCDVIVEMVKILHFTDEQIHERVKFTGVENIHQSFEAGRPVMVLLAHYGNWEWIEEICVAIGKEWPTGVLYRPQSSAAFNKLMTKIRSRWFIEKISQKEAVRKILSMKRGKPFGIGFICDQRPNEVVLDNWTTFFGQKTAYVAGAELLGRKVGADYVYLDIKKPSRGHYVIDIKPVSTEDTELTRYPHMISFFRTLEAALRERPELWLWSHKRWSWPDYSKILNQDIE